MYSSENFEELRLVEEFINNGELKKAMTPHNWADWIDFHRIARDENQSPEVRAQAEQNIKKMMEGKAISQKDKNPILARAKPLPNLANVMNNAKGALEGKVAARISQFADKMEKIPDERKAANKEFKAEDRAKERAKQRAADMLPDIQVAQRPKDSDLTPEELAAEREYAKKDPKTQQVNMTRRELDMHAKKFNPEPKLPNAPKLQAGVDTVQAAKLREKGQVDNAFALVHQLHSEGLLDDAHNILKQIPTHHFNGDLKGYSPAFIHHGIAPNHWKNLNDDQKEEIKLHHHNNMKDYNPVYAHFDVHPETWQKAQDHEKQAIKAFHQEILDGKHDNDPNIGPHVAKIKQYTPPKIGA